MPRDTCFSGSVVKWLEAWTLVHEVAGSIPSLTGIFPGPAAGSTKPSIPPGSVKLVVLGQLKSAPSAILLSSSRAEHSVRGMRDLTWLHDAGVPIPFFLNAYQVTKKNAHFLNNFFLRPTGVKLTITNYSKFIWLQASHNRLTLSVTVFCESR